MSVLKPTRQAERVRRDHRFRFTPEPEVTAWELARFIALLVKEKPLHFMRYLALSPQLQRHFKHTKNG